ncbi:MAG: hypothetical protein ACWA5P_04655 [bacterium]
MKKSFLFISCEEAKHICDKTQYNEATGWERIKLGIRLSWCKVTRAYSNRNNQLTKTVNDANVSCMNNSEKDQLKAAFEKQLLSKD